MDGLLPPTQRPTGALVDEGEQGLEVGSAHAHDVRDRRALTRVEVD